MKTFIKIISWTISKYF